MKFLLITPLLVLTLSLHAQTQSDLQAYNQRMNEISRNGMISLGSWAVANIGVGTVGFFTAEGEVKYFHGMNTLWNLTNLSIAIPGLLGSQASSDEVPSLYELNKSQRTTEVTYLANAGLDVGYMMGGLYLNELAKNASDYNDLLSGFGKSIVVQGGYLFVFDIIMYAIHRHHASQKMPALFEKVSIAPKGMGMSVRLQLN